jgi:hypothetical protein
MIKKILKQILPQSILNQLNRLKSNKQLCEWKKGGCPVPPPHIVKQLAIKVYQRRYGINTLVETGTLMGDMLETQKRVFKNVISIELGYN